MGRSKEEFDARQSLNKLPNGGLDLIDDGSGRLRENRSTHPHDCACLHCRQVCCFLCHRDDPGDTKVWKSLTGFGRHVQTKHPGVYRFENDVRKTKRLTKQLQELNIAKQAKRFERTGLRRVPIKALTERDLKTLNDWVRNAREGSSADPLLLGAIELADDKFRTQEKFDSAMRRLSMEVERGVKTGTYVTSQRTTHFDPRVAIQILKICWALGRGWSFVVHLLLLYGLNAFVESLSTEGVVPPTKVPNVGRPGDVVASASELAMEVIHESE